MHTPHCIYIHAHRERDLPPLSWNAYSICYRYSSLCRFPIEAAQRGSQHLSRGTKRTTSSDTIRHNTQIQVNYTTLHYTHTHTLHTCTCTLTHTHATYTHTQHTHTHATYTHTQHTHSEDTC